jgi:alpha-glucosidase (family GH31 glycosyl hydrolase)
MRGWIAAALICGWGCDDGSGETPVADSATLDANPADADPPDAAIDMAPGLDMNVPVDMAIAPECAPAENFEDIAIEDWVVQVDRATGAWAVQSPDGRTVLNAPDPCIDGEPRPLVDIHRGAPGVTNLFGAFRFDFNRTEVESVQGAPEIDTDGGVTLRWTTATAPIELRFEAYPEGGLWIGLRHPDATGGTLRAACDADESFFGLGTQVIGPDLRGRTFPLWTQEQGNGKPENGQPFPLANIPEAAYAPMGVWHSSAGYTAVIGHDALTVIDVCDTEPERLQVRSHAALPSFVLMPGATPKERLTAATGFVGRPTRPADWVLGPWNDTVGGPERLEEMATQLRDLDIPSSAIWTEDWIGGTETATGYRLSYAWEWDRDFYPQLDERIVDLHARGFAFLGYFNSFVPDINRMWDEGQAGGFLIQDADGAVIELQDPAFRNASLVDLYNPEAVTWLEGYLRTAAGELQIDGWMADFSEWLPVTAVAPDGSTGWTNHNPYPLRWAATHRRIMDAVHADDPRGQNDWAVFVRSGWASINGGTPGIAQVLWAGDQNTNWGRDDGFPTIIPLGTHAGLAGAAWFATDIGGYNSLMTVNTSKELFFRWASAGAFLPVMRTHHGGDHCDNWSFERDADSVAHYRRYARIRTLLHPYIRALGNEATDTGIPPMRHGFLVEPDNPAVWAAPDQYFLGDALLVAPIVEEGATRRDVVVPGEGWWPLFGDTPGTIDTVPPTELIVYVRPGTILPLLGDVVDSFYGATADGVTDLSDVADRWRLGLYPTAEGGLTPLAWEGPPVEGAGWATVDWAQATFDAMPLPLCGPDVDRNCRTADGVVVDGPGRLEAGDAWLTVGAGRYQIAIGGAAFGVDRMPTPLMAIDTPIETVRRICPEEAPEE